MKSTGIWQNLMHEVTKGGVSKMASLEELVSKHHEAIILCMEEVSNLQGTVSAIQDVVISTKRQLDRLERHIQDKEEGV